MKAKDLIKMLQPMVDKHPELEVRIFNIEDTESYDYFVLDEEASFQGKDKKHPFTNIRVDISTYNRGYGDGYESGYENGYESAKSIYD